jgi:hypothetical protein
MLRALSVSVRLVLCASFLSFTWPAVAQQPKQQPQPRPQGAADQILGLLARQDARISELESALRTVRSQNAGLSDLVKVLLANQESASKVAAMAADPAKLKQDIETALPRADTALKQLAEVPESILGKDLKQKIKGCIDNVKSAADLLKTAQAPDPAFAIKSCSDVDQRAILAELEKLKRDALKDWDDCVSTLEQVRMINPSNLPRDPSGLSEGSSKDLVGKLQQLKGRFDQSQGKARECLDKLGDAYNKLRGQENAAAAMSMALGLAAQVCVASGGNPYVCGAILIVAMLMDLFKGGGGGGDGDGDGKGKGTGPGPETVQGVKGNEGGTGPLPSATPPGVKNGGTIEGSLDGRMACNPVNDNAWLCWQLVAPDLKLLVDAKKALGQGPKQDSQKQFEDAIREKQGKRVFFCTQPSANFLAGLIVTSTTPGKYYDIKASYDEKGGLLLAYPGELVPSDTSPASPESLCADQLR